MPQPFYMTVHANGSQINGECVQEAHQDKILCQGLSHGVSVPGDEATGSPTGSRVHHKLTILKTMDKATPLLFGALTMNQTVDVLLEFYRIASTGIEELYFTIALAQGRVCDVELDIPNCLDARNSTVQHMERVSFAYQRITWTAVVDGIEHEDEWAV